MKKILLLFLLLILIGYGFVKFLYTDIGFNTLISVDRKLSGLYKKSIQIDGQTITYLEGGKGQNLLLLHGFAADKDNWTRFSKYLTGEYHVVAIDIPGFGESSRTESLKYDVESQAYRVKKFSDLLKFDSFHIAGNSMGGHIAALVAVKYPKNVISLALFDSGGFRSPNETQFHKDIEKDKNPLIIDKIEDFDKVFDVAFQNRPFIPKSVKDKFAQFAVINKDFNKKIFKDLTNDLYSLGPKLSKIEGKTLILWGEKDKILDVSCVPLFEKGLKNHKTIIIKDCGHVPMLEKPKETAEHYKNFLKNL